MVLFPFDGPPPPRATHFFTQVAFEIMPEINHAALEAISQLSEANNRDSVYVPLRESLQKIQWAKLSGFVAIDIDQVLTAEYTEEFRRTGIMLQDHVGQMQHSKAVFEVITYCKSALDSMSIFLNDRFTLGFSGGQCDLKFQNFRQRLTQANAYIGDILRQETVWLDQGHQSTESIFATRDFWIHRGVPQIAFFVPPSKMGTLPIPKRLDPRLTKPERGVTKQHYWSTSDFVDFHLSKTTGLFSSIVQQAIIIERQEAPNLQIQHIEGSQAFFPLFATETLEINAIRLGPYSRPRNPE